MAVILYSACTLLMVRTTKHKVAADCILRIQSYTDNLVHTYLRVSFVNLVGLPLVQGLGLGGKKCL